jgi:cytoskeletal protein CcmA (bactofilin family)
MKKIVLTSSILFAVVIALITALIPSISNAAEVINNTEVFLVAEKTYDENLYVGAAKTIIESNVAEDLAVLGGEVIVTGKVAGDVFILGGDVDFRGEVIGDLRVIGGNLTVGGRVDGDVLVLGGNVKITEDADLYHDVLVIGGSVKIDDTLDKEGVELKVVAGEVNLNSEISSHTEVTAQNLVIGSNAVISGDFSYYSPNKFYEQDGSVVIGNITYNEIKALKDTNFIKKAILSFVSFWYLLKFITTLVIAFILVYIFKPFTQQVSKISLNSFWKSFLASILTILLASIAIPVLLISLIGLPIGVLLSMVVTFVAMISSSVAAIYIGMWAQKHLPGSNPVEPDDLDELGKGPHKGPHKGSYKDSHDYEPNIKVATIGVILITLLDIVPAIGPLVKFVFAMVAFGSVFRYFRRKIIK